MWTDLTLFGHASTIFFFKVADCLWLHSGYFISVFPLLLLSWNIKELLEELPAGWLLLIPRRNRGFPGGTSGPEPTCKYRRHKRHMFGPWVGKIPWRATHSSVLVWEIPWTEEPGRLQSMGSQRVRHDWATQHEQWAGITEDLTSPWALIFNISLCCFVLLSVFIWARLWAPV